MNNQTKWGPQAPNAFASQSSGPMSAPVEATEKKLCIPAHIVKMLAELKEPANRDGLLVLHAKLTSQLAEVKANEMEVRKLTVDLMLGADKKEGTNNVELGGGYIAKAVVSFNYKLVSDKDGRDVVDAVDDAIDDFAKLDNEGPFIASRLFKWTAPTLSLTEYRKLEEEAKTSATKAALFARLQKILAISESAPTLEIKAPKGKKS